MKDKQALGAVGLFLLQKRLNYIFIFFFLIITFFDREKTFKSSFNDLKFVKVFKLVLVTFK